MSQFAALQPYVDRGILLSMLQQDALVEATSTLGGHRWDVDMTTGRIVFTSEANPAQSLTATSTLIATIAPAPRSVMWGWAHPQGSAEGDASALRTRGERDGVDALTQPELPFPAGTSGDDDAVAALAHEIGQATAGILGRGPYYSAPLDGGTRAVLLLDASLPPVTLAITVAKLQRLLSTGMIRDARTAIWGLATTQSWSFQWTDNVFHGAMISDGVTTATIGFDDLARVTHLSSGPAA